MCNLFLLYTKKFKDIKCCSSYDKTNLYCQGLNFGL